MNRRQFLLSLFPLSLLAIILAERVATSMLGSSQLVWNIWIEVRPLARIGTSAISGISSDLTVQSAVILTAAVIVLLAATNRWTAFTINIVALFYVVSATILASVPSMATGEYFDPNSKAVLFIVEDWLQLSAIGVGLLASLYAAYSFMHWPRRSMRTMWMDRRIVRA